MHGSSFKSHCAGSELPSLNVILPTLCLAAGLYLILTWIIYSESLNAAELYGVYTIQNTQQDNE